jgi:hypothetical protein
MWKSIWDFVKGLFGSKGTMQIGSGNQAMTASTSGVRAPVIQAGRDAHVHMPINSPSITVQDPFADLEEPVKDLLAELAKCLVEHPLLRVIVVTHTKTNEPSYTEDFLQLSEDNDPKLRSKIGILVGHGLIVPQDADDYAYRLSEPLVKQLRKPPNKYKVHDMLLKWLRKGHVICPWDTVLPEVSRQELSSAIAFLRHEGLADISIGGHCIQSTPGKSLSLSDAMSGPPAFTAHLTDKGFVVVDQYGDNIVEQYLRSKK